MCTCGCMFTIVHHMDEAEMLGGCVHVCTCGCMFIIVLCTHHMDEVEMLGGVYTCIHVDACLL